LSACCGTNASIEVDSSNYTCHSFVINTEAVEQDCRAFGSGNYGSWIACARSGTIDLKTYDHANLIPGDICNIVANICNTNLSADNAVVLSAAVDVDAKGVVEWTYRVRLTGDITGW